MIDDLNHNNEYPSLLLSSHPFGHCELGDCYQLLFTFRHKHILTSTYQSHKLSMHKKFTITYFNIKTILLLIQGTDFMNIELSEEILKFFIMFIWKKLNSKSITSSDYEIMYRMMSYYRRHLHINVITSGKFLSQSCSYWGFGGIFHYPMSQTLSVLCRKYVFFTISLNVLPW
jgi:hypothetical protein